MTRVIGYYWVMWDSKWEVAKYNGQRWNFTSGAVHSDDRAFTEIDERRIERPSPQQQPFTSTPLAAGLKLLQEYHKLERGQPDELSKAQERIARLEEVLRQCRALMKYGKNDIDRFAPIWDQIEIALKP